MTLDFPLIYTLYRVRHMSINTPLSHERLVGGLQDGGRGTHVTHFVQLYPQPVYTASQVRTTCRSWDEGGVNRCMPHRGVNRLMPHRGVNRCMPHRGVNRLMPHPVLIAKFLTAPTYVP